MTAQSQRPISTDLEALLASWLRSLRARNVCPATLTTYSAGARQLAAFLAERGVATAREVDRAALEDWIGQLLQTRSAATANNRYRAIQQWFAWMVEEDEIEANPTARMRPPQSPEQPVEVLTTDQIRGLLKACEGRDFVSRRDAAIIRLFADTGMRLSELAGLTLDDLDLDAGTAAVLGKGHRMRVCPFGAKTAQALDRYLRVRAGERGARSAQALWLSEKGRGSMQSGGIAQMLKRRGPADGIAGLHPHQLRHSAVHAWLASGGAGRRDAPIRVEVPPDAQPLRLVHRRRAGPRSSPPSLPGRPSYTGGPRRRALAGVLAWCQRRPRRARADRPGEIEHVRAEGALRPAEPFLRRQCAVRVDLPFEAGQEGSACRCGPTAAIRCQCPRPMGHGATQEARVCSGVPRLGGTAVWGDCRLIRECGRLAPLTCHRRRVQWVSHRRDQRSRGLECQTRRTLAASGRGVGPVVKRCNGLRERLPESRKLHEIAVHHATVMKTVGWLPGPTSSFRSTSRVLRLDCSSQFYAGYPHFPQRAIPQLEVSAAAGVVVLGRGPADGWPPR